MTTSPDPDSSTGEDPETTGASELPSCDGGTVIPFAIADAEMDGDELQVVLLDADACTGEQFTLCWDGSFSGSDPVETSVALLTEASVADCESLGNLELEFDLSPLGDALASEHPTAGQAIVNLEGWPDPLELEPPQSSN